MIQVRDLRKRYRKNEALKGVSFSLNPGITGLLGPNGAGKTTLLRCMLGVVKATSGEVLFADGMRSKHVEIGYLPQKYGLLKELTVNEALRYYGALKAVPDSDIQEDIDECLRKVNMLENKESRVGTLSGGMIRRVGVAAALVGRPSVLIFDEPTAGLDPEERVRFKRLASDLGKTHAVLISTHIVEDIEAVGSKVIVLNQGEVCASGTLQDIADLASGKCFLVPQSHVNEHSEDYYIEKYVEVAGETFARVLSRRCLEGFTPSTPTVEDGYLCVTKGIT